MKKLFLLYVVFFCGSFLVYAQSEGADDPYAGVAEDLEAVADRARESASAGDEEPATESAQSPQKGRWAAFFRGEGAALSTGKRESRRYLEIGALDLELGIVGVDLTKLFDGSFFDYGSLEKEQLSHFTSDIRLFTNPVYVKVPIGNLFTLDVFTGAQANIYLSMSDRTLDSLKDIIDLANAKRPDIPNISNPGDIPGALAAFESQLEDYINKMGSIDAGMTAGASVFVELGAGVSKTIFNDRLWVRAAPSMFFTLIHMKNNSITLAGYQDNVNKKYGLRGTGSMKLYSAWDLDEGVNPFASPGVDLTLEGCYALWSVLDVGVSVSHIPIVPSTLTHSTTISADRISMTLDASQEKILKDPTSAIDFNIPKTDDLLQNSESESETVVRPVRFDFYTLYKPFKSPILMVRPNIGATVNSAAGDGLLNWGVNIEFNAPIILSAYVGTGLTEGVWANRVGIALDFRLFEVDLGAAIAAANFADSFSPESGMKVALGIKTGF